MSGKVSFNEGGVCSYKVRLLNVYICFAVLAGAVFYFEQYLGLEPCPMCVGQRLVFLAIIATASIGMFVRDIQGLIARISDYAGLSLMALGIYVAYHHVSLQNAAVDPFSPCMPSVDYIVKNLPFQEVVQSLFYGKAKCSDIEWSLFGISIPGYSLLTFSTLFVLNLVHLIRRSKA